MRPSRRPRPTIGERVARQLGWLPNLWRLWVLPYGTWLMNGLVQVFSKVRGNTAKEEEKVVVDGGVWSVMLKCLIHVAPLCATIVLAAINLKGFFIGNNYLGSTEDTIQSLDQLLLQITAKLYELLIVASLTTIVLDVLRRELLTESEGLPLGFVFAPFQFQDLTYWLSPDFWYSQYALRSRAKRYKIVLLLATSTTIAIFAGPSSALLMLPQTFTHWPGGGAHFTMAGGRNSLWPDRLQQFPRWCALTSPNSTAEEAEKSCSTGNFEIIAQTLRGWRQQQTLFNIDITDGLVRRHMNVIFPDFGKGDTWAIAPHLATCLYSEILTNMWHQAIFGASEASSEMQPFFKYRYRKYTGTTATIQAQIPIVRVNCRDPVPQTFQYWYTVQPEIGETKAYLQPVAPARISESYVNSSRIATVWVPPPADDPRWNSSAYLNIQFPSSGGSTEGTVMTCSVDARWASGNIVGSLLGFWNGIQYYNASVWYEPTKKEYPGHGYAFPAFDQVSFRKVHLDSSWLQGVVPQLGSQFASYTTLSSALEVLGFAAGAESFSDQQGPSNRNVVEAAVAALIVDGMSQTGYAKNGGENLEDMRDVLNGEGVPTSPHDDDLLLSGRLNLPLVKKITTEPSDPATTQLRWDIFIGGLGYSADSVAYYLALTVVFAHALLALVHTVWSLGRRQTSGAWASQSDMLALAINSQPTAELAGTAGGIKMLSRLGLPVRIRDVHAHARPLSEYASSQSSGAPLVTRSEHSSGTDYNSLQLLVGKDGWLYKRNGLVELNGKY